MEVSLETQELILGYWQELQELTWAIQKSDKEEKMKQAIAQELEL